MILIDYKDRRPIYEQVVERLADLMLRGILEENSQLPSVRSLATDLSINPNTIQRAYAELERQGYIYSVKGRGSFVAENHQIREQKKKAVFTEARRLVEEAKAAGISMLEFQEQVILFYGSGSGGNDGAGCEAGKGNSGGANGQAVLTALEKNTEKGGGSDD